MRFVSFNVCGIKGILSRCAQWLPVRSFESMFEALGADVVCFQETKIQFGDITRDMTVVPGFNAYFTCSTSKKGYSGVAMYVRSSIRVYHAEEGLTGWLKVSGAGDQRCYRECGHFPSEIYPESISAQEGRAVDEQGRVVTLDMGACVVIGVYCPANSQGNMQEYRDTFFDLLDWRIHKLRELGREVVVMGDLNVAREPRDSAPLRMEMVKAHIKIDEEEWMYASVARTAVNTWVMKEGFKDTVRDHHPARENMFTCWDQSRNCRAGNFGSRIDYVLASEGIECNGANIMPDLVGSDHCPVYADLVLRDITAQSGHPLPALAKTLKSRWPLQINSFFRSTPQKPVPKPNVKLAGTGRVDKNASRRVHYSAAAGATTGAAAAAAKNKQKSVADMFGLPIGKKIPECTHGEPCVLRRSTKPPRQGDYFYVCGRRPSAPLREPGPEHQCKTFVWESDA